MTVQIMKEYTAVYEKEKYSQRDKESKSGFTIHKQKALLY